MAEIAAPVSWVESVSQLRLPASSDQRLQDLMERNTDGWLSQNERAELESLVDMSQQLSVIRAGALHLLGRNLSGTVGPSP